MSYTGSIHTFPRRSSSYNRRNSFSSALFGPIIKKVYHYISPTSAIVNASIIAFIGAIFFIVSFTSPYWLQSYAYTYSQFSNMGLWEFCFNGYRHYDFQYDTKYIGCNHVFAHEFQPIREWLLPAWMMAVQSFAVIALLSILTCLATLSFILIRWPLKSIMRYEWHLIGFCFCLEAITVVSILFAVLVFGVMCWSRSWLLNPNFNYLSWSYIFAVIAGGFHATACAIMLNETFVARDRKRQATNLLQMETQGHIGPANMGMDGHSYI